MYERLEQLEKKYDELTTTLSSPEIMNDSAKYQKSAKAHAELSEVVERYHAVKDLQRGISESKQMLAEETDAELRAMAQGEVTKLEQRARGVQGGLRKLPVLED